MANWNEEQAGGEAAMRKWQRDRERAEQLVAALRASGITSDDCRAVETLYALAGQTGSHRIVEAMRYLRVWLGEGRP
jgi:hypothetical protein